jgi:hypothetical protein
MVAQPHARTQRLLGAAVAALAMGGCELQEIATAESVDVLVAEVVLRSDAIQQTALLHRPAGWSAGRPLGTVGITVSGPGGAVMHFDPTPVDACLRNVDEQQAAGAACFAERPGRTLRIEPGVTYSLRIETGDGRLLTGSTTLPGAFRQVAPERPACRLPPDTVLPLRWTASEGAWAYIAEAHFAGLQAAFAPRGITVPDEPLSLTGVSVSGADTTMLFPTGFGVFNRFDEDYAPTLVALQHGVPAGVNTTVVVAAADRNYVNWVRGGNFNPSGPVRVGSIRGDGIGVFGSLTQWRMRIDTRAASQLPAC